MRTTRTPLTGVARKLRVTSTQPERRLWYRLRDRRFAGHKFRRQCAIGGYVVDFVCVERRLVVELDGGQHGEQVAYDEQRTLFLLTKGFRVMRFWNDEVMQQLDAVLEMIGKELDGGGEPGPSPWPSPRCAGRGDQKQPASRTGVPSPHASFRVGRGTG